MNQIFSFGRVLSAILIAMLGCIVVWVAVPYNNFVLHNTYLSDSFLPEIVVALLLVALLLINPLLRLIGASWVLDRRQLALIASIMIFAAVIPSNGLMRMFPRLVAEFNQGLNQNVSSSRVAADAGFRQSLFPDPLPTRAADGSVQTFETPISQQFIDELDPGQSIPWSQWAGPIATWGLLILAMWTMMLGLAGVVFPQWRDRERLPFPLINVFQALTANDDESSGRLLPAIFYSKGFWVSVIVVFFIHGLRGLNVFTGSFPSFPLDWDLSALYEGNLLRNATIAMKRQYIFFSLVGVAYFIPSRYAISVWGWVLLYSIYLMFGKTYIPAFEGGQVDHQSLGVLLSIACWVLWLGRSHWANVGRAMLGRGAGNDESRRDAIAGWMFAIGCAGMICWLYWAGCALWWCILATAGCAIVALLMARIIAETGVPFLWLGRFQVAHLTALFPLAWLSPQILLFNGVFYALLTRATAVSAAVMATMALGVDRQSTPKQQSRLLLGGLVVLALGLVVCGAVHLDMGYSSAEVDTTAKTGANVIDDWTRVDRSNYKFFTGDRLHQGVGFGVGTGLLWACSRFVSWPIHPVGILFCQLSIGNLIWFSIFLGWLLKVSITSLLGGGAYRKVRPVFLGLILGELIAAIFWALVPVAIVLLTGADPAQISRYTLIRYP